MLNTDGDKKTCRKGGAENKRPENYHSQLISATTVTAGNRSRPTLPSSTDGMSAVSDRPSVTSASYHRAMASSFCRMTTDAFEQRVQTLYRNGCLIWLGQPWIYVVMRDCDNCYCFKRFKIAPYHVTKARYSRLLWQTTVNSSQLCLIGGSTRHTVTSWPNDDWRDDWHPFIQTFCLWLLGAVQRFSF